MNWINSNKYLLLLMLGTVLVRLPNLNRPLSKHHEFNTAVTLINAQSWQLAGGAGQFYYTPLMNFQGGANKILENGPHVDSLRNHLYLSFGAGAFVVPYLFFQLFHLPPTPLWLQILNLIFSLWGIWLFYKLILQVAESSKSALVATTLYACLPSVLWYTGNGYVNTAIMLPFVILVLMQWHRIDVRKAKNSKLQLLLLFVLLVLLTWFDWLSFFLGGMMMLWALWKAKTSKAYLLMAAVVACAVAMGILLVLFQFAAYFGWDNVLAYWKSRFTERSADTSRFSFWQMVLMCIRNLLSGYLPVLLLLPLAFLKRKKKRIAPVSWPFWALIAIIPYNGLFFNWSAEHEFAWLAFGLMACVYIGIYLIPVLASKSLKWLMAGSVLASLAIYFVINRPGNRSWRGDLYADQAHLGGWIKQHVNPEIPLITNIPNDKITEYYSHRTFNTASNLAQAQELCALNGIQKATWLYIDDHHVQRQVLLIIPVK